MRVTLHLPAALRPLARHRPRVRLDVEGGTLADLLVALRAEHPELAAALLDENGAVRRQMTIYVGDDDARNVGGGQAALVADVYVVAAAAV